MKFGRDSGEEVRSHNAFDAHAIEDDEEEFVSFLLLLFDDDDDDEEHGSMGHWNNDRQSLPSLLCASSSQQPCVDGKPGQVLADELFNDTSHLGMCGVDGMMIGIGSSTSSLLLLSSDGGVL
jgi:hypothetical protein